MLRFCHAEGCVEPSAFNNRASYERMRLIPAALRKSAEKYPNVDQFQWQASNQFTSARDMVHTASVLCSGERAKK
jgi:hypothetical protein